MSTITEEVDVDVPVRVAYDQWTQFETFPKFMEGVREIRQLDDTHTHWVLDIAGQIREFDATITEQHPDERVAWHSDAGPDHAGVITFHRLDDAHTRVTARWTSTRTGSSRTPPTNSASSATESRPT